jgi:hypothetical protein
MNYFLDTEKALVYTSYLQSLEQAVRADHDPILEFHNAEHPCKETFPVAQRLAQYCLTNDVEIDILASDSAAIGHDKGFHRPLEGSGFKTKEHRSAHEIGLIMRKLGAPRGSIRIARGSIISTHRNVLYMNENDAVLGYADMINTCLDYDWMLHQTYQLRQETQRLLKKSLTAELWLKGAVEIIADYHMKPLPPALAALPLFQQLQENRAHNLERLKKETPDSFLNSTQPRAIARAAYESSVAPTVDWLDQLIAA